MTIAGEDMRNEDPLLTAGGNINWCIHHGNQDGFSETNAVTNM